LQHEVEISKPFYMGAYTVTQAQYRNVMGKNFSWFSAQGGGKDTLNGLDPDDFPVDNVTWHNAMAFCAKASVLAGVKEKGLAVDLPTEAEWEYACRAGTTTVYHYGNAPSTEQANFAGETEFGGASSKGPSLKRSTTVGSYAPNAWGLYDMHGNVFQWCKGWYEKDYYSKGDYKDPLGPQDGKTRVARGGSWAHDARICRAAFRGDFAPTYRIGSVGFRIVLRSGPLPEVAVVPPVVDPPPVTPKVDMTGRTIELDLGGGVKMQVVRIDPGKFLMGSPPQEVGRNDDEFQHEVEIAKPYYLGIYTVTQAQYLHIMGQNKSFFSSQSMNPQIKAKLAGLNTDDFPVEAVVWNQAMEFCRKVSLLPAMKARGFVVDLPTEAEWEYACRAGTKTVFAYGNTLSSLQDNFNGRIPYGAAQGPNLDRPTKVGSYAPNAWGLYDMHGNVRQFCKDWYDKDYYQSGENKDPQGPTTGQFKVVRGGAWNGTANTCRVAVRMKQSGINTGSDTLGFRVAVRLAPAAEIVKAPPGPEVVPPKADIKGKIVELDLGGGVKMQVVRIDPGKFLMGSPPQEEGRKDDEFQHEVEITKPYYMGMYTVT
jgi:formylglycine-generating enzyme required for sulfatase activity